MLNSPGAVVGGLRDSIAKLKAALRASKGKQVQSETIRNDAKGLVTLYFQTARSQLVVHGLDDESLSGLDKWMQDLLELAQRNALRSLYDRTLKAMGQELNGVEVAVVASTRPGTTSYGSALDGKEERIASTLRQLVPSAGASCEQACIDLRDRSRRSYRGAAAELREALREVLDHLAPDDDVAAQPGFKPKTGATKPTMKQKTQFILVSRGRTKSLTEVPERAVEAVEEKVGALARSLYTRSSFSTHIGTTLQEVRQIKAYIDVVLGELLEIA